MTHPEQPRAAIPTPEDLAAMPAEHRAEMAAAYLASLEPGRQPLVLFTQMARLAVLSTVEVIPIRDNHETGRPEVLLTQRPLTNDWWAGKWHVPGVVLLPSDATDERTSYMAPVGRLFANELGGAVEQVEPPRIIRGRFASGPRGTESTLIHWSLVRSVPGVELPNNARFFDAQNVIEQHPEPGFVTGHDGQVAEAVEAYMAHRA